MEEIFKKIDELPEKILLPSNGRLGPINTPERAYFQCNIWKNKEGKIAGRVGYLAETSSGKSITFSFWNFFEESLIDFSKALERIEEKIKKRENEIGINL